MSSSSITIYMWVIHHVMDCTNLDLMRNQMITVGRSKTFRHLAEVNVKGLSRDMGIPALPHVTLVQLFPDHASLTCSVSFLHLCLSLLTLRYMEMTAHPSMVWECWQCFNKSLKVFLIISGQATFLLFLFNNHHSNENILCNYVKLTHFLQGKQDV